MLEPEKTGLPAARISGEKTRISRRFRAKDRKGAIIKINGASTEHQRSINGKSTENQRSINGKPTDMLRQYNVRGRHK